LRRALNGCCGVIDCRLRNSAGKPLGPGQRHSRLILRHQSSIKTGNGLSHDSLLGGRVDPRQHRPRWHHIALFDKHNGQRAADKRPDFNRMTRGHAPVDRKNPCHRGQLGDLDRNRRGLLGPGLQEQRNSQRSNQPDPAAPPPKTRAPEG
jgi:hypothetical protein